jgi:hypothetical protein
MERGSVNHMDSLLKRPAGMVGTVCAASLLLVSQVAFGQPAAMNEDSGGSPSSATTNAPQARFAQPGTVNYVEGQAKIDGQTINQGSIGSAKVGQGQVLQTVNGKAEMLLTPGVFLRLGPNSSVKMLSPSLSDTQMQLVQGQAMMEVADFQKENHIQLTLGSAETTIKARGIYEFIAAPAIARVYDGKAEVLLNDRTRDLGKGDQVALNDANAMLKTQDFNLKKTEASDDLYAWSKLRADYTAQANMSAAETYAGYGPVGYVPGWYGAGWYWDPYFNQYAFLLADGFLWDPFGFGFFSPGYWGAYAPYIGFGYYGHGFWGHGGYYGRGFPGHPGGAITRSSTAGLAVGGGFRGGMAGGFHGGGFGDGFHGGGFGGFHGGGGGRR